MRHPQALQSVVLCETHMQLHNTVSGMIVGGFGVCPLKNGNIDSGLVDVWTRLPTRALFCLIRLAKVVGLNARASQRLLNLLEALRVGMWFRPGGCGITSRFLSKKAGR
eukprot:TRINITY_DN38875_c0_g1_i1.p3 TRINITY_DN38875_c0_g1~~TRINITY_DN38875_c0_g1_i1.p3  ORF type:complete len:109 (-),score=6.99 TRINITY_DN38875_c0_g1_i1:129-455(-)